MGSTPGPGRAAGGNGNPFLVFLPGKPHGQRSLAGHNPWGGRWVGHNLTTKQQQPQRLAQCLLYNKCLNEWNNLMAKGYETCQFYPSCWQSASFHSCTKDICTVVVYVISTHLFSPSSSIAPRSSSFMISFVPGTVLDNLADHTLITGLIVHWSSGYHALTLGQIHLLYSVTDASPSIEHLNDSHHIFVSYNFVSITACLPSPFSRCLKLHKRKNRVLLLTLSLGLPHGRCPIALLEWIRGH